MSDEEAIDEATEAEEQDDDVPKPGAKWFTARVTLNIDVAQILFAVVTPPVIGGVLLAWLSR
jgi:hypothetical protein